MKDSIAAIILAAGSSGRMGSPKALLNIGNKTFLQHIIDVCKSAGIDNIVVVLGSNHEQIRKTISTKCSIVINDNWQSGQLSSVREGLKVLESIRCNGALIWPVDHPLVNTSLIKEMLLQFKARANPIVLPSYQDQHGHPFIISRSLFNEIKNASLEIGMNSIIHLHGDEITYLPTEEQGVVANIDTPADYEKYFGASISNSIGKL